MSTSSRPGVVFALRGVALSAVLRDQLVTEESVAPPYFRGCQHPGRMRHLDIFGPRRVQGLRPVFAFMCGTAAKPPTAARKLARGPWWRERWMWVHSRNKGAECAPPAGAFCPHRSRGRSTRGNSGARREKQNVSARMGRCPLRPFFETKGRDGHPARARAPSVSGARAPDRRGKDRSVHRARCEGVNHGVFLSNAVYLEGEAGGAGLRAACGGPVSTPRGPQNTSRIGNRPATFRSKKSILSLYPRPFPSKMLQAADFWSRGNRKTRRTRMIHGHDVVA